MVLEALGGGDVAGTDVLFEEGGGYAYETLACSGGGGMRVKAFLGPYDAGESNLLILAPVGELLWSADLNRGEQLITPRFIYFINTL